MVERVKERRSKPRIETDLGARITTSEFGLEANGWQAAGACTRMRARYPGQSFRAPWPLHLRHRHHALLHERATLAATALTADHPRA